MITAIIPTRNDPLLADTIASLRKCGDKRLKIIVVDDASNPETLVEYDRAKVDANHWIYNKHRLGPGMSKHVGAMAADTEWLMFSDSHMLYPEDWFYKTEHFLRDASENDIFCSTYVADKVIDPFWHETHTVGGCSFYWWKHMKHGFSFADLDPQHPAGPHCYQVPAVLGACYLVNRNFFNRIDGFSFMTGYGSEEIWLSWAAHLTNGTVNCIGSVPVVHRSQASGAGLKPNKKLMPEAWVNKIAVLSRILPNKRFFDFLSWLPIDDMIKNLVISQYQPPFLKFNFDLTDQVLDSFGLQTFDEAIELMEDYHNRVMDEQICESCGESRGVLACVKSPAGIMLWTCNRCRSNLLSMKWRQS